MRIRTSIRTVLAILYLLAVAAQQAAFAMGAKEPAAPAKPLVAVSILPQAYFVERIAGGIVEPLVIVGPGQSPHSYEPTPRQMAELSRAAAWFSLGVEFERALGPKLASLYPSMRVVDTTVGVRFRTLEAHHQIGRASCRERV